MLKVKRLPTKSCMSCFLELCIVYKHTQGSTLLFVPALHVGMSHGFSERVLVRYSLAMLPTPVMQESSRKAPESAGDRKVRVLIWLQDNSDVGDVLHMAGESGCTRATESSSSVHEAGVGHSAQVNSGIYCVSLEPILERRYVAL